LLFVYGLLCITCDVFEISFFSLDRDNRISHQTWSDIVNRPLLNCCRWTI